MTANPLYERVPEMSNDILKNVDVYRSTSVFQHLLIDNSVHNLCNVIFISFFVFHNRFS